MLSLNYYTETRLCESYISHWVILVKLVISPNFFKNIFLFERATFDNLFVNVLKEITFKKTIFITNNEEFKIVSFYFFD